MTAMVGSNPALALSAALFSAACVSPPPRTVTPARPLGEEHALRVIREVFRDERDIPAPGPDVDLSETTKLHVDVIARDRKYGVAYVTTAERAYLGTTLPPRDAAMGDALQLVSGLGADADARVLVLQDTEYPYDDRGPDGDSTSLSAEAKLRRDVHDFLLRAHTEKWP